MPYTLWSRDRLLGTTDFGFVQCWEHVRFGFFLPSPEGLKLMPVLTGGPPAFRKVSRLLRSPVRAMMRGARPKNQAGLPADIRRTTAYADFVANQDELARLELELRDPDGNVVETDDIGIDDMEWKLSLLPARLRGPEDELPRNERYQIQVQLRGVPQRWIPIPYLD